MGLTARTLRELRLTGYFHSARRAQFRSSGSCTGTCFARFAMRLRAPLQLQFFRNNSAPTTSEGALSRNRNSAFACYSQSYFADAGNAGNFPTSRASRWMMTCAFRFDAICLMRSIDATVWARSCSTKERSRFQAQDSRELEPIVSGTKRQFVWTANALRTFNIDDAPHNSK